MGAGSGGESPGGEGRAVAPPGADGQIVGGTGLVAKYANFVKLPHTLFALPFAFVGVVLGSSAVDTRLTTVVWVVIAFTTARFAAMGFNRIVDRAFDARNPRTAFRELPSGTMGVWEAWSAVVIASALFLWAAWMINPLCFALSPAALTWVMFYSYTKRFTRWSHLVLGLGLGIAPVGGYLAVTGSWSQPQWMLVALACAVAMWTAGFDIIYAMQDVEVDRQEGLFSLPAAIGPSGALLISGAMHVGAVLALAGVGVATHSGLYYYIGTAVAALLLAYEHRLAARGDLQKAFFAVNMSLSTVFLVFVLLDRLLAFTPIRGGH